MVSSLYINAMGSGVSTGSATIGATKGGSVVTSYTPGEKLVITITGGSGSMIMEASKGSFTGGACTGNKRIASGSATVTMPAKGTGTVTLNGVYGSKLSIKKITAALTEKAAATKVNCVGAYGSWGACSKTCGAGTQTAAFAITKAASGGGTACAAADKATKSRACTMKACPAVNCAGSYGSFGACSKTCGAGTQTAKYAVTTAASGGGTACPASTKSQSCTVTACAVACVGAYGAFGACSKTCGAGTQTASYAVSTAAANGGGACAVADKATKSQACTLKACAVDCVGSYGAWTACSKTCGAGTQTAKYTASTAAANGGTACPAATKSQSCTVKACPVNCVGSYGAWGTCFRVRGAAYGTCGAGTQDGERRRQHRGRQRRHGLRGSDQEPSLHRDGLRRLRRRMERVWNLL